CRGRSRSTARARRTSFTRRSCTSSRGTWSRCSRCSGSTGASRCGGRRCSRCTSRSTPRSVPTRRRSGSTRRAISPASGSTSGCRSPASSPRSRSSSGGSSCARRRRRSRTSRRPDPSRRGRPWPSREVASGNADRVHPVIVRELELDLDAFEGPFDLLLTLVLKDELDLAELDIAAIVLAFLERLAEREELDLDACGEFLVLISALLELKARGLFPEEAAELAELEPEQAAEELARRLAEYRRMKEAAGWLRKRLETEGDRYFRVGPAPLAPKVEPTLAPHDPARLATVIRLLATPPPEVSLVQFLERFRSVLSRRSRFDFDQEVAELSRIEQAVAFLALLELRRGGEISIDQAAPFAPIRISRADVEREDSWTLRSA